MSWPIVALIFVFSGTPQQPTLAAVAGAGSYSTEAACRVALSRATHSLAKELEGKAAILVGKCMDTTPTAILPQAPLPKIAPKIELWRGPPPGSLNPEAAEMVTR